MSKSLFLTALVLAGNLGAQADRIVGKIDAENKVILQGNVNREAHPRYDQGPVDAEFQVGGMTLVLKKSAAQQADLEKLLADQQDPSSPDYHKWLTPEQYAERFGASRGDMAKITDWLTNEGFRVDYVAQGRNWILFSGTAGQVHKSFGTELRVYRVDGERHFANASDPLIPTTLRPLVLALTGLDDFRPKSASRFHPMTAARPDYTSSSGGHSLVPNDIGTIYDIAPLWAKGFDGKGMTIAVIGQHDVDLTDVSLFRNYYGLPKNDPQKVQVPGAPAPDLSCCEAQLDLEWSGAMAPNATLLFVMSNHASTSAYYAIDQNVAPIITYSFYSCEPNVSSSSAAANRAEAQKANAEGITWVACTGDVGAAGCESKSPTEPAKTGLAVSSPSSIPEVTGVGGTEFDEGTGQYWNSKNGAGHDSALSYIPEKPWNDSHNDSSGVGFSSTGGGVSIYYAKPAWQAGPGVPSDLHRDVPDISFAASSHHDGYFLATNGVVGCCWGGTSVSTPIFAGILALLSQYQISIGALAKPGLGNVNPRLYAMAQTVPGIFNDVTVGSNIMPCVAGSKDCVNGGVGYNAGPGYDPASGLGSADVYRMVTQWSMPAAGGTATTTSVTASAANIAVSASTKITATVKAATGSATPTGSISFSTSVVNLGSATLSGSAGTATASITIPGSQLAAGTNTVNAKYSGDAGFSASSGSVSITVTGGAAAQNVPQLSVVSATSKQVQLAWTAVSGVTSYSLYRLPTVVTSSGIPGATLQVSLADISKATPIISQSGLNYTDTLPDAFATYTYVVTSSPGQLSNPAIAGPPPFGFNIVIPSTEDTANSLAVDERMELDGNGDPAMSFVVFDPNGDGDDSDDSLYFVSWNRAKYAWNEAVKVAVTGTIYAAGPGPFYSLARDAATGMWGLEYIQSFADGSAQIKLATSTDNGVTWKSQSISGQAYDGYLEGPSLALWNGTFYAIFLTDAWFDGSGSLFPENGTGFVYVTGKVTDAASKWTENAVPFPGDYIYSYFTGSLALDSSHNPGIAFNVANDTYEGVAFWRPGTRASTLVGHNDGYTTNDNPTISLAFYGTEARIVTDAPWNYNSYDPDNEPADLWAMRATSTAGTTWYAPVDVPPDSVNILQMPWIATGSKGQTAIGMASNNDPEGDGMLCGFPKIARSSNFQAFQTCAPAPADNPSFAPNNAYPVLRFGGNDKLWLVFNNNDDNGDLGLGLVLWREP